MSSSTPDGPGPHLAIVLEKLAGEFDRLTPDELLELRATAEARRPGFFDQFDAAGGESIRAAASLSADGTMAQMLYTPDTPEWLRLTLFATHGDWIKGVSRTCMHAPSPELPQAVIAAAGRPGLVVCAKCVLMLRPPTREAGSTCDVCGHICTSAEGDLIYAGSITRSTLTLTFGVCGSCAADFAGR